VALLDTEKSAIIENKYGFTEVLKHVNDMAHRIDLEKCLSKAEGLAVALKKDENLPEKVTNILGLAPNPSQQQTPPTRGSVLRERHGTEGSNVSATSLEHSSSVEVLSEMEDEVKFESDINSGFF